MRAEVNDLNALFERVQSAATRSISEGMDRAVRTAAQIVAGARGVVDGAVRDLETQVAIELGQSGNIIDKARETTANAIDHFLERHAPPDSRLCLQLMASPEANVGHVTIDTPHGITAVFGVAIPATHAWARPRRVGDLLQPIEIHMPKESGWLSKRMEMAPLKLERFFISDVTFSERSGVLRLRRGAGSGTGYQMRVDLEKTVNLSICPVREDGGVEEQRPLVLEGSDRATMLSLWQNVVQSSYDLLNLRRRMVSATFGERSLVELDSPRVLAEAFINNMAPVVVEISRRSGAPGELVLRRTLGEGRREETYCTHAELLEKIMVLPPDLRVAFAGFNLSGPVMSGRPSAGGVSAEVESRLEREAQRLSLTALPAPSGLTAGVGSNPPAQSHVARPPSVPPPGE